jgi:hypothetical protein
LVEAHPVDGRKRVATVQERIEAMERAGAGVLVDQTLKKLAGFQLQKYEKCAEAVRAQLAPFEAQYGLSSADCHRRFTAGELGDSADLIEWMGLYDNLLLYLGKIDSLKTAAEV